MCKRHKGFTILELIVVIAILAILAIIAVPNFIGAVDKSKNVREKAEIDSVYKAVSMYYMENGTYPVIQPTQPVIGNPENVDFGKIYPKYLDKLPHFSYWIIDYKGSIYHEKEKPATKQGNILTLNREGYEYEVYGLDGNLVNNYTLDTVDLTEYSSIIPISKAKGDKLPLINAGFTGITEHPEASNAGNNTNEPAKPINTAPIPVIKMLPETNITPNTTITWDYDYTDTDSDTIQNVEWSNKQNSYAAGLYTVKLRVQDSRGLWSNWVEKTFAVTQYRLGQQLANPEAGWARYEQLDYRIKYSAGLTVVAASSYYSGGSVSNIPQNTTVTFKFKGTSLRVIGTLYTNCTGGATIDIDGVKANFNCYGSAVYRALLYEKTGLENTEHTVVITATGGRIEFDAIDLDSSGKLIESEPITIGQRLNVAAEGWTRYDDRNTCFIGTGALANPTADTSWAIYGDSIRQSNTIGDKISFSFYGTKLRLIGATDSNRSSNIEVTIDGKTENFSQYSSIMPWALNYEKLGLTLGTHTVTITIKGAGWYVFDAVDIDDTGYMTRSVGQVLTTPDAGWQRIDDMDSNIAYNGTGWGYITTGPAGTVYNGTGHYMTLAGATNNSISFKFYGTRIRLIDLYYTNRVNNVIVNIDGTDYEYNPCNAQNQYQVMVFEKLGLYSGIHTVTMRTNSIVNTFSLDAIDIDGNGYMVAN